MRPGYLPLAGAAVAGFAAAALLFSAWSPKPALAQKRSSAEPQLPPGYGSFLPNAQPPIQPLEVQALDGEHFVVVTREPRMLTQDGKTAQNVICTVVTHYTVRGDRLVPIEHARIPTGYELVVAPQ